MFDNELESAPFVPRSVVVDPSFDWQGDQSPQVPWHDTVLYETHVRGLQTHRQKLERALPGSRVAINLSGLTVEQAERGSVVALPGALTHSTLVDVSIEMLAETPARRERVFALKHNTAAKVFHGAAHSLARIWLLDAETLAPGRQAGLGAVAIGHADGAQQRRPLHT